MVFCPQLKEFWFCLLCDQLYVFLTQMLYTTLYDDFHEAVDSQ